MEIDTYQGAEVTYREKKRNIIDRKAFIVRIWDGLAEPQIWIECALIGRKRDLN